MLPRGNHASTPGIMPPLRPSYLRKIQIHSCLHTSSMLPLPASCGRWRRSGAQPTLWRPGVNLKELKSSLYTQLKSAYPRENSGNGNQKKVANGGEGKRTLYIYIVSIESILYGDTFHKKLRPSSWTIFAPPQVSSSPEKWRNPLPTNCPGSRQGL